MTTAATIHHRCGTNSMASHAFGWLFTLFATVGERVRQPSDSRSDRRRSSFESIRNCVLVIDVSDSMHTSDWVPSRLAGAQQSSCAFVDRLALKHPNARVAVVAYSWGARTHLRLTPLTDLDNIKSAICRFQAAGCTNITAGLKAAQKALRSAVGTREIVLLSDGFHNRGPGPESLLPALHENTTVNTVGIGGARRDVDERTLLTLATCYPDGSKRYRWIGDPDALTDHFEDLAGGISRS